MLLGSFDVRMQHPKCCQQINEKIKNTTEKTNTIYCNNVLFVTYRF